MSNLLPRRKLWGVLAVSMILFIGMSHGATKASVVFAKQAKSKGEITLGVTPPGGEMQQITITIVEKMNAKQVAAAVAKELSFALSEVLKVEQNGAKVKLKPVEKKATFEIRIVNQTVQGISVTIQ